MEPDKKIHTDIFSLSQKMIKVFFFFYFNMPGRMQTYICIYVYIKYIQVLCDQSSFSASYRWFWQLIFELSTIFRIKCFLSKLSKENRYLNKGNKKKKKKKRKLNNRKLPFRYIFSPFYDNIFTYYSLIIYFTASELFWSEFFRFYWIENFEK